MRRGVESPWERIRAIDARTTTPLGIALRGRFLVGSKPVSTDIVRRFVACAAENGIDVFRLHDPLNDVSNLREAGEAIVGAGRQLHVGLVYSPGRTGESDALVEQAKRLGELGAARVLLNDPTGALLPHVTQELVERLAEASGLPVGLYVQAAGGTALANALVATRVGADVVTSATPGKVADDGKGQYSVLVTELLNNVNSTARRGQRLQQDPYLRLPRLRRRAGAASVVIADGRRPPRRVRAALSSRNLSTVVPANAGTHTA